METHYYKALTPRSTRSLQQQLQGKLLEELDDPFEFEYTLTSDYKIYVRIKETEKGQILNIEAIKSGSVEFYQRLFRPGCWAVTIIGIGLLIWILYDLISSSSLVFVLLIMGGSLLVLLGSIIQLLTMLRTIFRKIPDRKELLIEFLGNLDAKLIELEDETKLE